jgi:hypothetical protein
LNVGQRLSTWMSFETSPGDTAIGASEAKQTPATQSSGNIEQKECILLIGILLA